MMAIMKMDKSRHETAAVRTSVETNLLARGSRPTRVMILAKGRIVVG